MRRLEFSFRIGQKFALIVCGLLVSASCGGTVGSDGGGQRSDVGGNSAGGQNVGGVVLATGGNKTTGAGGTVAATGGATADFCTGSTKVVYHGRLITPAVTQYTPLDTRNCCRSYGMRLHTSESLGFDLQVVVSSSVGSFNAGNYVLDTGTNGWGAGLRTATESVNTQHHATGHLIVAGDTPEVTPWQMGVCIQVDDTSTDLNGTQVYVPGVPMDYYDMRNRLGIWLLDDASTTAVAASQLPLDSLTLAAQPLISISYIEFVEQSTGWVALNSGMYSGDSLRGQLGQVNLYGLPFVVVADGARIYLGGFFPAISSVGIADPTVMVDNINGDGITSDGFTINPPYLGPTPLSDPRNDPRILKVLSETGRLAP